MKLRNKLPDVVASISAALLHIGRGSVVDQLQDVELVRWTYDDFADAVYLYVQDGPEAEAAEIVVPLDDVSLELDAKQRIFRIEVLGGRDLLPRLE